SNTTSAPRPSLPARTAVAASAGATAAAPSDATRSRRRRQGSAATTDAAPAARASWATRQPMVPAPSTATVQPATLGALRSARIATDAGSANAATSESTVDGTGTHVA